MTPWIQNYSKLTYFGAEFETECARFRPASTGIDHVLATPLQSKLIYYHL